MSDGFVWASYLLTYGLIAGYVVMISKRAKRLRREH
jgi:heme exporter protein CcmD